MEKTQQSPAELSQKKFDVIIVGGGPSGSSSAIYLSKAGKNVLLLDRATFPRDKTCGDGISGKSVRVLRELGVLEKFENIDHLKMYGVTFSSPKGKVVEIPAEKLSSDAPPGFVCRREVFDNLLFQTAKSLCNTIENFFVNEVIMEGNNVVGVSGTHNSQTYSFKANIVIGADGAGSTIAKKFNATNSDPNHQVSALRAYYNGVTGMNDKIELHFVEESLPGYFWIFPLENGKANVGIGMLVSDMKKKAMNLENVMYSIIQNNPLFKERFAKAEKISQVKRWHLPLGSWRPKAYGNGYLLVGDAASLIDPFTGEGIGNGLISGKIASQIILKAFEKNDFTENVLSEYQKALYDDVGPELDTSYKLQKMGNHKWLLNLMIDKASRSPAIREAISSALLNPEAQKQFYNPLFYLKVLLA